MMYQNFLKTQQPNSNNNPSNNPGSASTSNGSEGFNKTNSKSNKLDDHMNYDDLIDDKPVLTFQNNDNNSHNFKNIDDIPIVPKVSNFEELLNKQLQVEEQPSSSQVRKVIKYEPRRKRSDLINLAKQPAETKKYKYYSQNFDRNFGKDDMDIQSTFTEKPKLEKVVVPSGNYRPKSVKETLQVRDKRMKE
jgi:hypothetical protein